MQQLMSAIFVLVTVSACALGNQEAAREIEITVIPMEETEDFNANATASAAASITPTLPPTPTQLPTEFAPQATVTPTLLPSIRNTDNCTVRDDLPTYTVVAGDTLSNIASHHNTSSSQLSDFNCLSDANLISVGMSLHVPIQATVTHTPTPILNPNVLPTISDLGIRGTLSIHPAETFSPNWSEYFVESGSTVTINWTGIEPEYSVDIVSITIFFTPSVGATSQLGIDDNMSDGMSITWTVPPSVSGIIIGSARTINDGYWRSSTLTVREAETDTPSESDDGCQFRLTETGDVYSESNISSALIEIEVALDVDYTILDLVVRDFGQMVKINLNDNLQGWLIAANGIVDCD